MHHGYFCHVSDVVDPLQEVVVSTLSSLKIRCGVMCVFREIAASLHICVCLYKGTHIQ